MELQKEAKLGGFVYVLIVFSFFEASAALASPGTINYYWNLTDSTNSADWLVIAHDDFYDNADLYRLAQFRAFNNSFDVGIVNLSDVVYQFNETPVDQLNDTAIKNFIAYVYENWTKKERVNNDIFVLLVGDVAAEGEIDYMPSHMSDLTGLTGNNYLTDNWYADVNGSDRKQDVYIGRFSTKDNDNLSIISNKTIKYENAILVTQEWLKKLNFINGADAGFYYDNMNTTYEDIRRDYTSIFGFYHQDISLAYGSTSNDITNNISAGSFITSYYGEGQPTFWMGSGGESFGCGQVPYLTNNDNLTLMLSFSCITGQFNWTSDTLAECAIKADDKGAVAFFGSTETVGATTSRYLVKSLFISIFENNTVTLGEAIKLTKDWLVDVGSQDHAELYNLLGDPALGIKDYRQPDITIAWPVNATVEVYDLNFSLVEPNPDSCWYSNDSGVTNVSLPGCANTTMSWDDGAYSIVLWANDSNGNENVSYSVDFVLDTVYPNVTIDVPGNATVERGELNFSLLEDNPDSCWYSMNGGVTNVSISACENTTLDISDGEYSLILWVNDTAGHENISLVDFLLDGYPNISLSSPADGSTWTSGNMLTFVYAVSDYNISNCSLIINDVVSTTSTPVLVDSNQEFTSTLSNGAYTWSVNCTDNSGHENSSATYSVVVSYNSSSVSVGGGGGGSVVASGNVETVSLVTGAKAGETKVLVFSEDVYVTEIDITLKTDVSRISFTAERLSGKPAETPFPTGKVHAYLKVYKDVNDGDISRVRIKFRVDKGWLAKNGFLAEDIILKRFNGRDWESLVTEHLGSNADYHYYAADTASFSYFAIAAESKPRQVVMPEPEEKKEEQPKPETLQDKLPMVIKPPQPRLGIGWLLSTILVIAAVIGTGAYIFTRKKPFV